MGNEITAFLNSPRNIFRGVDLTSAKAFYGRALESDHGCWEAHYFFGVVSLQEGSLPAAKKYFQTLLSLDKASLDACLALSAIFMAEKNFPEAVKFCERAIALDDKCLLAYNSLCRYYTFDRPDFDRALYYAEKSLGIDPSQLWPSVALAELTIMSGNFYDGFVRHAQNYPFFVNDVRVAAFQKLPVWQGEIFSGKKLIIGDHAWFAGAGDIMMLCRYLPQVKARGGRVTLPLPRNLWRLFGDFKAADEIIPYDEGRDYEVTDRVNTQNYDLRAPLISLPGIFGISEKNISEKIPYLRVPSPLTQAFGELINNDGKLKVGLVWSCGNRVDSGRTCGFDALMPLLALSGVNYYSLQMGEGAKEMRAFPNLFDLTAHITDFADTAALIENLDLVISVDTSVAHLAGALGKPVWTLLPFCLNWRWMLDRADSPWYPTMRLFRSKTPGGWEAVIEEVRKNLEALL